MVQSRKYRAISPRKLADKLSSLFKKDREEFEKKWNDIKIVIEYGMLSEPKFFEKAEKFALYPTVNDEYFTFEEMQEKFKGAQTDKDGNLIVLYANDKDEQHSFIVEAGVKGLSGSFLDSPIVSHLIQKLETESDKVKFARVDADSMDKLIQKEEDPISKLV